MLARQLGGGGQIRPQHICFRDANTHDKSFFGALLSFFVVLSHHCLYVFCSFISSLFVCLTEQN